ncbi:MAG: hypothetical protein U0X41_05220 [Chitinophagales bacterium]
MKKITLFLTVLLAFSVSTFSAQLYSNDGVKLNHFLTKQKVVYIPSMSKNIIIWKSTFELANDSKKAIAVRIPCYLYFAYAYLNPMEISAVQKYVPEIELSDVYKNYVADKPRMLNAKQIIVSEKFFATLDNVDLRTATMNWDFKFSFWY